MTVDPAGRDHRDTIACARLLMAMDGGLAGSAAARLAAQALDDGDIELSHAWRRVSEVIEDLNRT
jgi:hypothetical protein